MRWHIHFDRPVNRELNEWIGERFSENPDLDPFIVVGSIQRRLKEKLDIRATFTMSQEFEREGVQHEMQGLWGRN